MQGSNGGHRHLRAPAIIVLLVIAVVSLALAVTSVAVNPHVTTKSAAQSASIPAPATAGPVSPDPDDKAVRKKIRDSIVNGRLLFVGASYSIGVGATQRSEAFPDLVAARLADPFSVDAVSGTGFQNEGMRHQGSFIQRIARDSPLLTPRLIIIQGGRDDIGYPIDHEYPAVVATIRLAERRFPAAQVVMLGPIPAALPVTSAELAIQDAISRGAAAAGAGFIDPIALRWITPRNERRFQGPIPGHPNDAGYAYITKRLLLDLPSALKHAREPRLPDRPTTEPLP